MFRPNSRPVLMAFLSSDPIRLVRHTTSWCCAGDGRRQTIPQAPNLTATPRSTLGRAPAADAKNGNGQSMADEEIAFVTGHIRATDTSARAFLLAVPMACTGSSMASVLDVGIHEIVRTPADRDRFDHRVSLIERRISSTPAGRAVVSQISDLGGAIST